MKIGIIGAGWFGCHLATSLLDAGHDVTLYERENDIFSGASGANQNRLHLGYHYPRSSMTRYEISVCFDRFIMNYPTVRIKHNLFAVANSSSIDRKSYEHIIYGAKLPLCRLQSSDFGITNVQDGIVYQTDERVIDTLAAAQLFRTKLEGRIVFNTHITPYWPFSNGTYAVIDCTGGQLGRQSDIFFEPAVMAVYDGPVEHFALTVMDGPFPCLYPTATPGVWRVSHVAHTARGAFDNPNEAAKLLDSLKIHEITDSMSDALQYFYPYFLNYFRPRYELVKAVRTKLKNNNASRECRTVREGRVFRVFSGKICSIFIVEDEVKKWLATL